ncbi:MAG: YSC84-related protein [Pseudomonadota bacterium]
MKRSDLSRRGFTLGALAATSALAACGNGVGNSNADVLDARVDATLAQMYRLYPNTTSLAEKASGMLVMPVVTEAGFGFGGAYGQGALRIQGATVDYYSLTEGSWGLQIGAQQYSHVLFFMTDAALTSFRQSPGWAVGADIKYVISDIGDGAAANSVTALTPVLAAVFNRGGLYAGAALEGNKYNRIIP